VDAGTGTDMGSAVGRRCGQGGVTELVREGKGVGALSTRAGWANAVGPAR
jgi:hypothetical protein